MFVGPSYRTVATGQTGAFVGYDVRRDSFSGRRRMVGTPRETRARETGAAVYTRIVVLLYAATQERGTKTIHVFFTKNICVLYSISEKKTISTEAGKQPKAPNSRPTGFYHSPP